MPDKTEETAKPFEWDFDGACAPPENGGKSAFVGHKNFTLGCFQWVPRGRNGQGKGLKKGKVQHRVKGSVSNAKQVYEDARAFCAKKNAQALDSTGQ